jgi:short-subunit dehydrogenase
MTNSATAPQALITGASGGIGETFARHLAGRGYGLSLVARREERLRQLAAELAAANGVTAEVIAADLAKDGDVSRIEERLRQGDIELLVNNAGFGTSGQFAELPLERELEEVDLNVRALLRLSHAALSPMIGHNRGAIINVASTGAFQAVPNIATYGATKAFVLHFWEALHEEAKTHGVTVTALCPGPVRTGFQEGAGLDGGRIPSMTWTSVDKVVESALAAARSGRAIATPGVTNAISAGLVKLVPRWMARRVAGRMMRDAMAGND